MFLKKSYFAGHAYPRSKSSGVGDGLRILIQRPSQSCESNVIVKSTMKLSQPTSSKTLGLQAKSLESCYLKSCQLCNKNLRPDKDIYMYRGDQGFCSVECRSKQIVLDEEREIETSTNHMLASIRYRARTGRCEDRVIQEDYSRRHMPPSLPRKINRAIFL